jgi:hypothetical protein
LLFHFAGKNFRQFVTVHAFYDIEQRYGIAGLVGLQRPDKVQDDVRIRRFQVGPFSLGLLHTIFAEMALASLNNGNDRFGVERL